MILQKTCLGFALAWLTSACTGRCDGPAPLEEAAGRFTLPAGFKATLFAGEPDVVQPIAFTFDDRGRLWVIENYSYPGWKGERKDRVTIFEDRDGDGRFDRRRVFLDNGSNLSGIEWGFGGVWLCSTPNLVFVPARNGDDVPDGEPVIKLDGWDPNAVHNVSSSLAWGPDGWLYGCNGILSNSLVGSPGASKDQRTAINCGVWRYHPVSGRFEAVAHGTTNPWGLDFDEYGQAFITNCVIEHLWHVVPGARFQRMFGQGFNPHSYQLMSSCADHIHWAGGPWQEARGGSQHDSFGGGHAHVGAMVYLGDNWPDEYRNQLFTFNLHGNRINQDLLERRGSGYVARHGADVLLANDPWFRGMTLKYGPDGGVYLSDWSDTGECHNYDVADRTNGRIYKVVYGDAARWHGNLAQLEDTALVNLLAHRNHWFARRAQRLLQERSAAGALEQGTIDGVLSLLRTSKDAAVVLRALWTLNVAGAATDQRLAECMASPHDVVRGWAVRLAAERPEVARAALDKLAALARNDRSPWVRLALAAALQRLPLEDRWSIAEALASHGEDAGDANIPLMLWYGVEPLVPADPQRALRLARQSQNPLICQYIVRRMTSSGEAESLAAAVALLAEGPARLQEPALAGLYEAIHGRRRLPMPSGWPAAHRELAASERPGVREQAMQVALIFGDPEALAELRRVAGDTSAAAAARRQAIASLTQAEAPKLAALLQSLLDDAEVRVEALRGLAALDDPATPEVILKRYAAFDAEARKEAVSALASRKAYAAMLLDAVENASIPRGDISAFHVQQLQNLKDGRIDKRLTALWGAARLTSADRLEAIARQKQRLTAEELARADLSHGRALFAKTCAACHRLFDDGGKIGPELTGSQRANLDYVLSNVLDPSAIVAKDYQLTLFQTADGRVLSGIATGEDEHSVTVQTATEAVVVPKEEIELRETSPMSMMPDGLLSSLGDDDIRDLVGYLASPVQVPLPAEANGLPERAD